MPPTPHAVALLLSANGMVGEVYSCFDRYISEHEVATTAKEISGSRSEIRGEAPSPKHQIVTEKLQALGMRFGGQPLLERTIREIVQAAGPV